MNKKIIIICGLHRSGTSFLSHALIKNGVDMGNITKDHYEDQEILKINRNHLKSIGHSHNTVPATFEYSAKFINQIQKYKKKRLISKNRLIGFKEPRISSFIELYHDEFPEAYFIACIRNIINASKSWLKKSF